MTNEDQKKESIETDPFDDENIEKMANTPVEISKIKKKKNTNKFKSEKTEMNSDDLKKIKPISFLNNVPLLVSSELSSTRITIRDLISYKKGSTIILEKLAGEPMDILINGEYVAKGEVVTVNQKYAVRFTDMIEKLEILNKKYNEDVV